METHVAEKGRLPAMAESNQKDYRKVCSSPNVDRSLLIRNFLDNPAKVILFTRPSGFGKSQNLSMLKAFFEMPDADSPACSRGKKTWKEGTRYTAHQGRYPVIHLDFSGVMVKTWSEAYNMIISLVRDEYLRHKNVLESPDADATFYRSIVDRTAGYTDWGVSLGKLSLMLHQRHGIKPMIIIDGYDIPLFSAFAYGFYSKMAAFLCILLTGAYKDNPNLSFGFFAGTIAESRCLSGIDNIFVDTVLDPEYSDAFGFSEEEALGLGAVAGCVHRYGNICRWSAPEWKPGSVDIRQMLSNVGPQVADVLDSLRRGESIRSYVSMHFSLEDIKCRPRAMLGFLLMSGCLDAERIIMGITGENICTLSLRPGAMI